MKRLAVLLGIVFAATSARAQLTVVVEGDAARTVVEDDLEQLETGAMRGRLTIELGDSHTLTVIYRARDGAELRRSLPIDEDRAINTRRVLMLAENLVRDEAAEILAELEPSPKPVAPAPVLVGQRLEHDTMTVQTTTTQPRWTFGALGYVAVRSDGVNTPGQGLFASYALGRNVAIGVTDVSLAPIEGQMVFSAGPYIEPCAFAFSRLQAFGQLGVPMQGRWGGHLGTAVGVQPFVGAGLRWWLNDHVSVGLGARVAIVATSIYDVIPTSLVQGTVTPSAGLELGVHL